MFFDRLDASAFSGRRVVGLKRSVIALAVATTLPLIASATLSANTNTLTDVDQAHSHRLRLKPTSPSPYLAIFFINAYGNDMGEWHRGRWVGHSCPTSWRMKNRGHYNRDFPWGTAPNSIF